MPTIEAMRESLRFGVRNHVLTRMGDHFKNNPKTAPGGAYGYEKRSDRYEKRKLRKKGHNLPNVLSGKTRNEFGNNARAGKGITATQDRARWTLRNYFPLNAQRRKELEAITEDERKEIAFDVRGFYVSFVLDPKNRRQRQRKRI
jgi:hypothetical protein